MSNIIIIVPEDVNAIATVDSGLSEIKTGEDWSQNESIYLQKSDDSILTIVINMGAGSVTLKE